MFHLFCMFHKSLSLSNLRMRWHDVFHLTEQGSIFLQNESCSRIRKSSYRWYCRWKYNTKFAEENVYNKKIAEIFIRLGNYSDELIKLCRNCSTQIKNVIFRPDFTEDTQRSDSRRLYGLSVLLLQFAMPALISSFCYWMISRVRIYELRRVFDRKYLVLSKIS